MNDRVTGKDNAVHHLLFSPRMIVLLLKRGTKQDITDKHGNVYIYIIFLLY